LVFNATTHTFSGTPSFNDSANLTVKVTVSDGQLQADQSFSLVVNDVTVNHAPTGSSAVHLTAGKEDTVYSASVVELLQGFSDVDGDILQVTGLIADHGNVTLTANNTFTLTPEQDYNGVVTLSYQVSDGKGGSISTSTQLVLNPVNDAPKALQPLDNGSVDEAKPFSYTIPSDAFVDVDGDALTYSATLSDGSSLPSWLVFDAATQTFSGTPSFNDSSVLQVTVTASDGVLSAQQSFTLDVIDINRPPVQTDTNAFTMDEDSGSLVFDVLSRIVDADGDALTVSQVNVDSIFGTVVLNSDQSITFTPNANINGSVTVNYQVSDGRGGVLNLSDRIVINPVNDAPVSGSGSVQLANGTEDSVYTLQSRDLLQGFSDVDGDT
jgi:hypothetical protein